MIEIETKLRRWGNSFGAVIPLTKIRGSGIKEGETITITIQKEDNVLREMFGKHKFKKPIEKIMREMDKELWPNGE
jgi:antitoxin component of MazEF toxin-antitoxin module